MNWQDLERKHTQDWEEFAKLKAAAWDKLEQERVTMYAAFGNDENKMGGTIVQEKVKRDGEEWQALWGEKGMKAKYLRAIHKSELVTLKKELKESVLNRLRQERQEQARQEQTRSKDRDRER